MENTISRWAVIVLIGCSLGACTTLDAPYDPDIRKGQTLFEQIPNNTSNDHCAGHLPEAERESWQTGRC